MSSDGPRFNLSFLSPWNRGEEAKLKPWTQEDVKKFIASDPIHGPNFEKLQDAGRFNTTSAIAGSIGFGLFFLQQTKMPPGLILGAAAGGLTGYMAGSLVPYWAWGIKDIDVGRTNTAFLDWMKKQQATSQ